MKRIQRSQPGFALNMHSAVIGIAARLIPMDFSKVLAVAIESALIFA
ncbi:MAG: hypothetical protein LBC69_04500 [Eubacteriaceae bacterium]|nr:hypothetical protein [Eubacteriaceae bacterium]